MKQPISLLEYLSSQNPYYLDSTPEFGRGLYASKIILPGETIMVCELLVLSAEDTPKVNQTELQFYTFKYTETQDCLCLGLGEIFNHSDTANVTYRLIEADGRKMMLFEATTFITSGAQLFINYAADTSVNTEEYIKTPSLIG